MTRVDMMTILEVRRGVGGGRVLKDFKLVWDVERMQG